MLLWKKLKDGSRFREAFWTVFSQSMNTESTTLWVWEYFVFHLKVAEMTRDLMKDSCLGGLTSPALFHLLNLWGRCWGRWQIILTCQGGISLKDNCASSCVSLYLLEGSLAGYWVLGPGHLSPRLPLLPLCLSCAMRLVMVEVEAQQRPY